MRRDDRPAWLHWGLGAGFPAQTRVSLVLGAVLAVLAAVGLAVIVVLRF